MARSADTKIKINLKTLNTDQKIHIMNVAKTVDMIVHEDGLLEGYLELDQAITIVNLLSEKHFGSYPEVSMFAWNCAQ